MLRILRQSDDPSGRSVWRWTDSATGRSDLVVLAANGAVVHPRTPDPPTRPALDDIDGLRLFRDGRWRPPPPVVDEVADAALRAVWAYHGPTPATITVTDDGQLDPKPGPPPFRPPKVEMSIPADLPWVSLITDRVAWRRVCCDEGEVEWMEDGQHRRWAITVRQHGEPDRSIDADELTAVLDMLRVRVEPGHAHPGSPPVPSPPEW